MKRGQNRNRLSIGSGVSEHLARSLILIGVTATSLWTQTVYAQQRQAPDAAAQQHIHSLIESLPANSFLRQYMEQGARGEGIQYPWMDKMRQEGVKRALVRTKFVWRGKPTEVKADHIVYFSNHDSNCGQIDDLRQLSKIRASGLEKELTRIAIQRTLGGQWILLDRGHPTKHGVCVVELFDDEWLPPLPVTLSPAPKDPNLFAEAADLGDISEVNVLLYDGLVGAEERDGALWVTLGGDDSCLTKALLEAGSDPNARDKWGRTLLMATVLSGAINNAKTLLAAGADITAKDQAGETALSIAERLKNQQMIQLLKAAGAPE